MNNQKERYKKIVTFIENTSNEYVKRINTAINAINDYAKLSNSEKKVCEFELYRIKRKLGSLYFQTNRDYDLSEKYFQESLNMIERNQDLDNEYNVGATKQMLAKEKILLYLSNKDEIKLKEAAILIDDAYTIINENNFVDTYLYKNTEQTNKILKNINNITTKVKFEIPYHLPITEQLYLNFKYNDFDCSINSKTLRSSISGFIMGDNVYMEKDKYGIINHSLITIILPYYINPNITTNVNSEIGKVYLPITHAIDAYNFFVKNYIVSTKKYWISELNELMIFNFETTIYAGSEEIKNIPISISNGISFSNIRYELNESDINNLNNQLSNKRVVLWEVAYNNAKSNFLIKNYKETIIWINIALENFTYYFTTSILSKKLDIDKLNSFIEGDPDYETFYLKDFISEAEFEDAIKKGKINNYPPSIYSMFKKAYSIEKQNISISKTNKLINTIKKFRNDIVHGKEVKENLKVISEEAIKNFEILVENLHTD